MQNAHTWAVVLAAGDGKRLSALTVDRQGRHVPKQFCAVHSGPSLFGIALARAQGLVPVERICAVVAREHEQWWRPEWNDRHQGNVIVQPCNRGTGNGVLLALATIIKWDPQARLIFLPADHHVLDEAILIQAMQSALSRLTARSREIRLLGIEPDDADPELGYVIPQETSRREAQGVRCFVEKPSRGEATKLIEEGGLWNSGIIVANGAPLLDLFRQRFLGNSLSILAAVAKIDNPRYPSWPLSHLYERISDVDFSHHILQLSVSDLRVIRVPPCGWSDLGTPSRVAQRISLLGDTTTRTGRSKGRRVDSCLPSLAEAVSRAGQRFMSPGIH